MNHIGLDGPQFRARDMDVLDMWREPTRVDAGWEYPVVGHVVSYGLDVGGSADAGRDVYVATVVWSDGGSDSVRVDSCGDVFVVASL